MTENNKGNPESRSQSEWKLADDGGDWDKQGWRMKELQEWGWGPAWAVVVAIKLAIVIGYWLFG